MGSHPTTVPRQLRRLEELPENPLSHWDDDTLKRSFMDLYQQYAMDGHGGWINNIALHAIEDEMVEREISPVCVIEEMGPRYGVRLTRSVTAD